MTDDFDINALIKLRIEQASDTVKEVEVLINDKLYRVAINRIYYGMFYILLALALRYNFKTSKHAQLIGWFNKTFIKEGLLPQKYGKIIRDAFEQRINSDYGTFIEFSKEEVEKRFDEMKDFIFVLEKFINKK